MHQQNIKELLNPWHSYIRRPKYRSERTRKDRQVPRFAKRIKEAIEIDSWNSTCGGWRTTIDIPIVTSCLQKTAILRECLALIIIIIIIIVLKTIIIKILYQPQQKQQQDTNNKSNNRKSIHLYLLKLLFIYSLSINIISDVKRNRLCLKTVLHTKYQWRYGFKCPNPVIFSFSAIIRVCLITKYDRCAI